MPEAPLCFDLPGWVDIDGANCEAYAGATCPGVGPQGDGVSKARNNVDASDACCVCGGGGETDIIPYFSKATHQPGDCVSHSLLDADGVNVNAEVSECLSIKDNIGYCATSVDASTNALKTWDWCFKTCNSVPDWRSPTSGYGCQYYYNLNVCNADADARAACCRCGGGTLTGSTPLCICPMIYEPVCGDNNITYGNKCLAKCKSVTYESGICFDR